MTNELWSLRNENSVLKEHVSSLEGELGEVRVELATEQRISDERAEEIERLLEEGQDTLAMNQEVRREQVLGGETWSQSLCRGVKRVSGFLENAFETFLVKIALLQELDAARVAERNAVLRAGLLEAELEYYKGPKFVEMDDEVVIQRSNEIAAVKSLYEKEINSRVQKLLVKKEKSCGCYVLPECKVCYDEGMCVDTVLPCGHMFCSRCASKLVECPMCRTLVNYTTFVFGIERASRA